VAHFRADSEYLGNNLFYFFNV
jgi:hypothetical protein